MKKRYFILIFFLILILSSCTKKNEEASIDTSSSSSDNFLLYSSLKEELDNKAYDASTSSYYKTNFSYDVSYHEKRSTYNLISSSNTCMIRNDSLYVIKDFTYTQNSINTMDEKTYYVLDNDKYYSYTYEGLTKTFENETPIQVYDKNLLEEFSLNDLIGFSQYIVTSESFDGTNGEISKENNTYTISMDYSLVKEESLVKFISNISYFKNIDAYITDDLKVTFKYTINDHGYDFEYGYSYFRGELEFIAKVNIGMNKIDEFEIKDFSDTNSYIIKYPNDINDTFDIHKVNDIITGTYSDTALVKYYLEKGKYGIKSDDKVINDYYLYDSDGKYLNKSRIILDGLIVNTNYFEIEEDGYYYISITFSENLKSFKLINVEVNNNINILEENNNGTLNNSFDYKIYKLELLNTSTITVSNNLDDNLNIIIPLYYGYDFIFNIKPTVQYYTYSLNKEKPININLGAGTYYFIVVPSNSNNNLNYDFNVSIQTII